jgi:DNA-binding NarL/FixJ family response regulator
MVSVRESHPRQAVPAERRYHIALIEERQLLAEVFAAGFQAMRPADVLSCHRSIFDWITSSDGNYDETLVLMSIGSQNIKGPQIVSALSSLREARPEVALVVMGEDDSAVTILAALDLGARGYIPTNVSLEVAIGAIILIAVGGRYVPASSMVSAFSKLRTEQPTPVPNMQDFTARQIAVVNALRQGKANKIIAYELNMRESTVKVHVRNIMRKLKAKNRTEVAFIAHSRSADGLISASDAGHMSNGKEVSPSPSLN